MSLRGVLADFPISDVFQLVAQQRKTGVLVVEHGGRELEVFFLEGGVLRARPGESRPDAALAGYLLRTGVVSEPALAAARKAQDQSLRPLAQILLDQGVLSQADLEDVSRLTTDETVFELFLWDDGRFEFRPEEVETSSWESPVNAEMFLLDALRMRDEWASVRGGLPDLEVPLTALVDMETFRSKRDSLDAGGGVSSEELEKLFNLVNGRQTARRVIDLSRLGTFRGARGLVAMVRGGVIRIERRSLARRQRDERQRARRELLPLMWRGVGLATAAGIGLSLLMAPAPRAIDFPMPSPVEELGAGLATERVQAALEAERWRIGAYPESLDDLALAQRRLLASVPLDRYSYRRLSKGYRLYRRQP